ncbi:hypothetical protein VTN31DRAFT_95 [Thermomyces dupontii]|uniref:uncharacterized protein n=1 Tax=Talaromyces thermophilus TaxID=28565 RepID=UPI003741FB2B
MTQVTPRKKSNQLTSPPWGMILSKIPLGPRDDTTSPELIPSTPTAAEPSPDDTLDSKNTRKPGKRRRT